MKGNNNIPTLTWPVHSPDINIIENIWLFLKNQVKRHNIIMNIDTVDDLKAVFQHTWLSIPLMYRQKLYWFPQFPVDCSLSYQTKEAYYKILRWNITQQRGKYFIFYLPVLFTLRIQNGRQFTYISTPFCHHGVDLLPTYEGSCLLIHSYFDDRQSQKSNKLLMYNSTYIYENKTM